MLSVKMVLYAKYLSLHAGISIIYVEGVATYMHDAFHAYMYVYASIISASWPTESAVNT